jgi:hypothetical protein
MSTSDEGTMLPQHLREPQRVARQQLQVRRRLDGPVKVVRHMYIDACLHETQPHKRRAARVARLYFFHTKNSNLGNFWKAFH